MSGAVSAAPVTDQLVAATWLAEAECGDVDDHETRYPVGCRRASIDSNGVQEAWPLTSQAMTRSWRNRGPQLRTVHTNVATVAGFPGIGVAARLWALLEPLGNPHRVQRASLRSSPAVIAEFNFQLRYLERLLAAVCLH